MNRFCLKLNISVSTFIIVFFICYGGAKAEEEIKGFSLDVKKWAEECRKDILDEFDKLVVSGRLKSIQLFDSFYIPIPDTYPQKYRTQYDAIMDRKIQSIIDSYLAKDKRLIYFIAVDKNGYVPTHNTIFSKPLTKEREFDSINNRTKRLFNDKTGLAAARNQKEYLLQKYSRDTGEELYDLSVPIMFQNQHWGAIRIGYKE